MNSAGPGLAGRGALAAVALRPRLWWPAVRLLLRIAPRGWWRRWPPLPVPSAAYAEFRLHTALGGPTAPTAPTTPTERTERTERALDAGEVVAYLEWCRRMALMSRQRRKG